MQSNQDLARRCQVEEMTKRFINLDHEVKNFRLSLLHNDQQESQSSKNL